jgi:metallo-beta-lactamase family protein
VDGAKTFRLGGDEIAVNATIHTLGGFSAHASQSQLISWIGHFNKPRPRLYLIHGEPEAKTVFRKRLSHEGWPADIPRYGESISL